MANELKGILKTGSKAKLIQLAIDSTINLKDDLLSEDEKEVIRSRANREGWDSELERATQKAKDILMIGLEAEKLLYQAMFFLQDLKESVEPTEKALSELGNIYVNDYNEETERYESTTDKPKEELEKDILNEVKRVDSLTPRRAKADGLDGLLETYLRLFRESKNAIYLLVNSKIGSYRLYKDDDVNAVKIVLLLNKNKVTDVIDIVDHLVWSIETLEEYKPEVLSEIERLDTTKKLFIHKDKLKDISKALNEISDLKLSHEDIDREGKKGEDEVFSYLYERVVSDEYLLSGIDKETKEKLKLSLDKLTEYVKYGR
ncbi:MAG: hypothetical protein M0P75_02790 [Candidatus Marinimicrobia bacterium]|jgi:hypothetical protein|nr:hypothetical protein [Candidatus Neomarinimicrobiota bacterium]